MWAVPYNRIFPKIAWFCLRNSLIFPISRAEMAYKKIKKAIRNIESKN